MSEKDKKYIAVEGKVKMVKMIKGHRGYVYMQNKQYHSCAKHRKYATKAKAQKAARLQRRAIRHKTKGKKKLPPFLVAMNKAKTEMGYGMGKNTKGFFPKDMKTKDLLYERTYELLRKGGMPESKIDEYKMNRKKKMAKK